MPGIIFLFVVVFIVIAVVGSRLAGQRRKLLRTWAQGKGWRFRQDKDRGMRERHDFDCLQRGHSRYAYNICQGQWDDLPVRAFDYHYTTGSGKNQQHHSLSAVIIDAPLPLKPPSQKLPLWKLPSWMREVLKKVGSFDKNDEEQLVDLVNDDGRNSNVFNNAPRALMCVAAKTKVELLLKLHKAEALACTEPCDACTEGCGGKS